MLPIVQNWNRVLSYAGGEYFVLFADDDIYHPEFLHEMSLLAKRYPQCHIFHTRVAKIDANGKILSNTALCPEYETALDFILHRLRRDREQFAPEFMVRTEKLRSLGGFTDLPHAWGSDDLTWFQMAMENGIGYSPKTLVYWRVSDKQLSLTADISQRFLAVELYQKWICTFLRDYSPRDDQEKSILDEISRIYPESIENQKIYLLALKARMNHLLEFVRFFARNRKRHELKWSWMLYPLFNRFFAPDKKQVKNKSGGRL
jgi:glycosyltransferase involved in cell wall biosynthesis